MILNIALNFDIMIFTAFLAINLLIGLRYSMGTRSTREYAIADRRFSTSTIIMTVAATCIGAGFFCASLTESYRRGLYFIIPALGEPVALMLTGYFLAPRMLEFLGTLSVAEAMGNLYGKSVRIITALAGVFLCTGYVALQFKVAGNIMQLFFDLSSTYALILSSSIVILYSAFGGIKAVTLTDIFQFVTFSIIIPLITIVIWRTTELSQVWSTFADNPRFDIREVLSIHNPHFITTLCLFLYFLIPSGDPAYFQRIVMSRTTAQAKIGFIMAGIGSMATLLIVCWTSVLLLSNNPNLNPHTLLTYMIEHYTYTGLKGLAACGFMAAIMSTADSYINSTSVLLAHDILGGLRRTPIQQKLEVLLLRLVALGLGIIATFIAYKSESLFKMLVGTMSFYMPVISVPLLLAIFGFRSSSKVVIIGMLAGAVTVLAWSDFFQATQSYIKGFSKEVLEETNAIIPGMLANLIAFIIAHNVSGRPTWTSEGEPGITLKSPKRDYKFSIIKVMQIFNAITNDSYNLVKFYLKDFARQDYLYMFCGLFNIVTTTMTMPSLMSKELQENHVVLFNFIYHSILICSFILLSYSFWPPKFKCEKFIIAFRIAIIPYILIFIPSFFVVTSNFGQVQLIIFLVNTTIITLLLRWSLALVVLVLGSYAAIVFYKLFICSHLTISTGFSETDVIIGMIYALVLVSSIIAGILRPKQQEYQLSHDIIDHLNYKIIHQKTELNRALKFKEEFLRNLQHESNTPLTGIYSMSQALSDCYDKLSEEQRKNAIRTILVSSERLVSYVSNLLDLSKLITLGYSLKLRNVNLSNLAADALLKCKSLYIPKEAKEDRDFVVNIAPGIMFMCDEYYIYRAIENIIINAIQYCKEGKIAITLTKNSDNAIFIVKDSGIGIPKQELVNIFSAFTTSSKTKTPAGGRGLGLALAKMAVEAHQGQIMAESGDDGSTFTLIIPHHQPT